MAETNKKLSDKEIIDILNKDTGKPPTWADTYNKWFATEYIPWQNSVQGTNTKLADFSISENGTFIPNASNPLWNWNTGADTAAAKANLDKKYIETLDAYNAKNGTSIKPDQSVLGANVQPNSTYRAPDSNSWWTDLRDTAEAVGTVAGNYFLPGSSLLTSRLVSEGAQEQLATDEFRLANLAAGATGGMQGNMANYGKVGEALGATSGAAGTTTAGTTTAGTSGGLLSNAQLDAQFIAADAAQLSAQGLSSAQIASTLQASGVNAMVAADAAQLAAQGLGADQIASTITQGMPTATAASGASGLFTGAGELGGAGTGGAAAGLAGGAAAGAGMSDLAKAGLIQGGLGLAGGLLQGDTTKSALEADAAARAALAQKTMDMGKFQPVGVTTRFGTSSFATDPTTGAITPSYTLSPEAKAYQDSLSALGTQGLAGGQTMMNLGQQYVGESPEAVRQRYMDVQNALLAPGNEQTLANLRNNLVNTGRQGLAYGATDAGGMGATNPELAAYYNSLANQQRQLAAGAETQYQNQVNFGTGLMGSATTPFNNVFTAQKGVEAMGQQPLAMSTDFANTVATRGAAQGANYAQAMSPSLQSSYNAANYNPYATALQGAANNPLVGQGLMKAWGQS